MRLNQYIPEFIRGKKVDTPCEVQYHRPESGIKTFRCALPEGHEGPHNDDAGNVGLSPDSASNLGKLEREIMRDLRQRHE